MRRPPRILCSIVTRSLQTFSFTSFNARVTNAVDAALNLPTPGSSFPAYVETERIKTALTDDLLYLNAALNIKVVQSRLRLESPAEPDAPTPWLSIPINLVDYHFYAPAILAGT